MALPPWTVEMLRRGIGEVARKASDLETLEKLKTQATEILQDLPETAARGINAVMRTAEAGKRSVQRWSQKHTAQSVPMLNASGVLIHPFGHGVPLSDEVLDAGLGHLRGNCVRDEDRYERFVQKMQKQLTGHSKVAIAVTHNFPAALTAFSQLVQERSLVIHRSHAVRLPDGVPLPEAFGTLLPVIQEVGSVGGVNSNDYDGFDSFCTIVADDGTHVVELMDFEKLDALQAVVLPVASLNKINDSLPSAQATLDRGADFVLMPGDGLCGGPQCGILIGDEPSIGMITGSPAWPALQASESVHAMLAEAFQLASSRPDELPIRALLSTGEENIRARADRMAVRLSGSDQIAACEITADHARLTVDGRWKFPSRQLLLKHRSLTPNSWAAQLREENPAVVAIAVEEHLSVDLRWIAAADDNQLARLLGGENTSEAE